MGQRIEQFDILKGIGIILVVIGHCTINNNLHSIIYSFHMPLFFMVSGFFFYKQRIVSILSKTIRHLLLPWLFFVIFNLLFTITFKTVSTHNITESITSTLSMINPIDEDCYILYRSIWFLLVLFMVVNIYNALSKILNQYLLIALSVIFYMCGYVLQFYINISFFIDTTLSVTLYYCIGCIFSLIYKKYGEPTRAASIVGGMLFVVFIIFAIIIQPEIDYKYNKFVWWTPFIAVPMTFSLFLVCILISNSKSVLINLVKKLLLKCGFFSLSILGFHRIFQDVFFTFYNKLGIEWGYFQTFIFVVISIPIILFISIGLQKNAPALIGVKKTR